MVGFGVRAHERNSWGVNERAEEEETRFTRKDETSQKSNNW